MTIFRRDGQHATAFHEWIRTVPELDSRMFQISVTDSDIWVHRYSTRNERGPVERLLDNLMLVELKIFYRSLPFGQRDTLDVVDKLLRKASIHNNRRRLVKIDDARHPGCHRFVKCFGVHVLQLSHDRPDSSAEILWDMHQVTEAALIDLFRFERDPDHPSRMLDTRRHHLRPARELHPQLTLVEATR
jgi:hypothetical protein